MRNRIALALFPIALLSMAAKGGCDESEDPILAPTSSDAAAPDATVVGDCPIPEPTCPSGSVYSVAGCECVQSVDAAPFDAAVADVGVPTPPLSGDCPIPLPATSPINVYVSDTPTGSTSSEFTMSALGSAGDNVPLPLAYVLGDGTLNFQGTGQSDETYQLTLDYNDAKIYQATAGWSVAGCGFLENVDLATDAHSP